MLKSSLTFKILQTSRVNNSRTQKGPTRNFKKLVMKLCHFFLKNYEKL